MSESTSEKQRRSMHHEPGSASAHGSARSAASAGGASAPRGPRRLQRAGLLLAAALLLAAPACTSSKTAEAGGKPAAVRQPTTVRVENRSFLDNNVYVLRGGQRIRLGMVTGNSTQTFTIPSNLIFGISALQFLVDPIGGSRQPISNEIRVSEGDEVQLVIPPS